MADYAGLTLEQIMMLYRMGMGGSNPEMSQGSGMSQGSEMSQGSAMPPGYGSRVQLPGMIGGLLGGLADIVGGAPPEARNKAKAIYDRWRE
jgi:hypothetical protein